MISVIVYGRNDEYGGLLQRRAALSLNSIARVLTREDDEIVFVDYNTKCDLLTFPESIDDTLSDEAKRRLRIIRVRPELHDRVVGSGVGPVVESLARNIGLRRTNPRNRWVLSTNTDVVIVGTRSLSDDVDGLSEGYYGAPRNELPRFLWEQIQRTDPAGAVESIGRWSRTLSIQEAVLHARPDIGFDAPGDFQLAPRDDFFAICGFDERMQRAWHVDSSLAVRLAARLGPARRLPTNPAVFHCEHTAGTQAKHAAGRAEDSWNRFVDGAHDEPWAAPLWGCPDEKLEVIDLNDRPARRLLNVLAGFDPAPATACPESFIYAPESYGEVPPRPRSTAAFLADRLANLHRRTSLGWIGADEENQAFVARLLKGLGFQPLMTRREALQADVVIIDGAGIASPSDMAHEEFWEDVGRFLAWESGRVAAGEDPRRVFGINAVHNDLEALLLSHFDVTLAPVATRLRPARLSKEQLAPLSLVDGVSIGPGGNRLDGTIAAVVGQEGYVFFGPYLQRIPARHRLTVRFKRHQRRIFSSRGKKTRTAVLEVSAGTEVFATEILDSFDIFQEVQLEFDLPAKHVAPGSPKLEIRLWTVGEHSFEIEDVALAYVWPA